MIYIYVLSLVRMGNPQLSVRQQVFNDYVALKSLGQREALAHLQDDDIVFSHMKI